MLIDHIGRLETQKPFAVLIDNLLLPSLDSRPPGSVSSGVSAAGGMHRRAAPARTVAEVGFTPTAFGAPPAAIRLTSFGGSPVDVTALHFAVARTAILVSHIMPPVAMVASHVMPPSKFGIFPISNPLISVPPSDAIVSTE
jgi:hypothetical protein